MDGVAPTPQTVRSGEYPLAERLMVAYRPEDEARIAPLRETLQAAFSGSDEGSAVGGSAGGAGGGAPGGEAGGAGRADWIRLSVAGDFMLARGVARAMRENGTLYPIEQVRDHLSSADLAFANLESPIGVTGRPLPGKQIWFRAAPEAVELLKAAGLDGVTVANNHIMDYDEENFLETLDLLAEAGIPWTGGGRNLEEARRPLVLEAQGVRIAFLGYSEFADLFFDWDYPRSFAATEDRPGVPAIREDWLAEDIRAAREVADVVAVALHWGVEFVNYPPRSSSAWPGTWSTRARTWSSGTTPRHPGVRAVQRRLHRLQPGQLHHGPAGHRPGRESMLLTSSSGPDGAKQVEVHPVWIHAEQPYITAGRGSRPAAAEHEDISGW